MSIWILIVFLVVLGVVMCWGTSHEGFVVEPTTWDALRNFFHYQVSSPTKDGGDPDNPGMIPVEAGLVQAIGPNVDAAIATPGFPTHSQGLFRQLYDDRNPIDDADLKCRALSHPRQLVASRASRTPMEIGQQAGCGWWFVEDPSRPSVGAYGYGPYGTNLPSGKSANQPWNVGKLPAGGRWIWDISGSDGSIELEEIKRCKAIRTCSLISGSDGCGFCPSKGHGIPVNPDKTPKYSQTDDGGCGDLGNIVTNSGDCPQLTVFPRDYDGDFNYDLNGNPIVDNKYHLIMNPRSIPLRDPCELENGRLTQDCRLRMCLEILMGQEDKGLHRIVTQGSVNETDQIAMFYLRRRAGVDIPPSFWLPMDSSEAPGRLLSKGDAEDLMRNIKAAATSGPPSVGRSAALWFMNETPFNTCQYNDDDQGPFPLQCVQREFRFVGCQPAGTAYPKTADLTTRFKGMTYGAIRTQFRDLADSMNADVENVREQDETIQKCLGVEIQRKADETYEWNPNFCREQGIEYWITKIPTLNQRVIDKRILFKNATQLIPGLSGLEKNDGATLINAMGSLDGIRGYTARTYVELSGVPVELSLTVPSQIAANYSLWVNGERQEANPGTNRASYTVSLTPYNRHEIEVRYETSGLAIFGSPQLTLTPNTPLYLAQSSWKPLMSILARRGVFDDVNRVINLNGVTPNALREFVEPWKRWGYTLSGVSLKSTPEKGLVLRAMKTLTCMFYWTSLGPQTNVWRWDQGNGGSTDVMVSLEIHQNRPIFTIKSSTYSLVVRGSSNIQKGWVHIGVLVGDVLTATKLYVNGVINTEANPTTSGQIDVGSVNLTRLILGGAGFEGSLSWLNIYTSTLTANQLERDMNYDNPALSDLDGDMLITRQRKR